MRFPNNKILVIAVVFLLLQISSASARTVVGEWWGSDCDNVHCAVARDCASLTSGIVSNPSRYRNLVCPSNSIAKEIDRIDEYNVNGVEAEPYIRYLTYIEFEYEEKIGSDWFERTLGPFQTRGVEIIECDCNENFVGKPPIFGRPQFCVDLEQGRYLDSVDGLIYDYLPNNHGKRCPPIDNPKEDEGCGGKEDNFEGNPCNVSTGNKYQSETDFTNGALSFTRSYNSQNLARQGVGYGWRHNFQRKLIVNENTLTQASGSGRGEPWVKVNDSWQGDADSDVIISEVPSGFQLTKANNIVENYSSTGQIESVIDTNGHQTTYSYNADETLAQVTNHYGLSVSFAYTGDKLSSVTDAFGAEYVYEYDANNNLTSVVYPDETPSDATDNPRRTYHYEDANLNHLTGITDENGDRYATWEYNSDGKAILTKHAETTTNGVGQETFELDYQAEAAQ